MREVPPANIFVQHGLPVCQLCSYTRMHVTCVTVSLRQMLGMYICAWYLESAATGKIGSTSHDHNHSCL